jgi:hypothetical protein
LTAISCLLTEDQRHFLAELRLWKCTSTCV